ncbi:MAG: C1 family peptidase [Cytophagales bacterium]|nr:DUF4384 domain-containing protein [Bernardetiaceae bacterium]MDW8205004.1 C1 family peptidase [Cytophagales bacterium]
MKLRHLVFLLVFALPAWSQERVAGCLFDPARSDSVPFATPLMRGDYETPSAASLKPFCPTPKDQGNTGTCTAWAAAYAARTILMAQQRNLTLPYFVDKIAFSPSFIYNQIRGNQGCQHGTYLVDALFTLKSVGAIFYSEFGFDCSKQVGFEYRLRARKHAIQDYRRLFSAREAADRSAIVRYIKKALAEGKPVVTAIRYLPSLDKAKGVWSPLPQESSHYYHAVTVVGYDDKQYGGAFELMNSWGTEWGNSGFIWVKYEDFQSLCMEAYEMIDFPAKEVPSEKESFRASVVLKQHNGNIMKLSGYKGQYQTVATYSAGTRFQMQLFSQEAMYVYAFGIDSQDQFSQLFPTRVNQSPLISYARAHFILPAEDLFIEMDNASGSEYLCLLFSRTAVDLWKLMQRMQQLRGAPFQRFKQALQEHNLLSNSDLIKYQTAAADFAATTKIQAVPIIIEIRRP